MSCRWLETEAGTLRLKVQTYPARGQCPEGFIRMISDGYLQALGIPLRAGRGFTEQDTPSSRPVVTWSMKHRHALGRAQGPMGQIVIGEGSQNPGRRVVGVVADVRHRALEQESGCELPFPHSPDGRLRRRLPGRPHRASTRRARLVYTSGSAPHRDGIIHQRIQNHSGSG